MKGGVEDAVAIGGNPKLNKQNIQKGLETARFTWLCISVA